MKRTVKQIQDEIDQHNRNISWTCGRAGYEGASISPDTMKFMADKANQLQRELEEAYTAKSDCPCEHCERWRKWISK